MRRELVGATLAVVMALSGGCSALAREVEPEQPNRSQSGAGPLDVVEWGVVEGLLSVRVVNNTDRTLERAEAVINIVPTGGRGGVSAGGSVPDDLCCTVLSLPPGGHFGLYVDLGPEIGEIADIEVSYADVAWSPAVDNALSTLQSGKVRLEGGRSEATVTTRITSTDKLVDAAAGQAFLTGPDGEFLAVVSGRFSCFSPGRPRTVVMELFHPVPDGTTVESVVAYPLRDATTTVGAGSCSG